MNCRSIFFLLLFFKNTADAQDSSSTKSLVFNRLYVDTYYSYDFSKPSVRQKAGFLYNHNKLNAININLALASISYNRNRVRGNFGLMAGTYAKSNLASEPKLLRQLFEVNAGYKVSNSENIWFDIGTMPSHIGFESAISNECWTATRSMLAENSPYYETGIRLSFTTRNYKLYTSVLLLNGWQRIRRIEGNTTPAFGTQITYKPSKLLAFNWSTFIGNTKPDNFSRWRYYNNLYTVLQLNKNWGMIVGLDYGLEQDKHQSTTYHTWYSPVIIARFEAVKWAMAGRVEYYQDNAGVIMPLVNNRFFQMQGYSFNFDRKIRKRSLLRLEWRYLGNRTPYFIENNRFVHSNHSLTASVVIDFLHL